MSTQGLDNIVIVRKISVNNGEGIFMEIKTSFPFNGTEKIRVYPNKAIANPAISVLVQTYNHEKYVQKCLDSILTQIVSFKIEILVGEDNSSDETRRICVEYAENYPEKIRLFLHDRGNVIYINGRPTGRYNFIYNLINANGKYIAICEGDDYWIDSLKLQKQYECLENNPQCSLCFHNATIIHQERDWEERLYLPKDTKIFWDFNDFLLLNPIPTASMVFRAEALNDIPNWFREVPMADWPLILLCTQSGGKAVYISDVMAAYRHHSNSIWSSRAKIDQVNDIISTYEIFEKQFGCQYIDIINHAKRQWRKKAKIIYKNNRCSFFFVIKSLINNILGY